jgi:hypothetical protein
MTHRNLPGQPIDVPETAVPIHRRSGWRTADEEGTEKATPAPPADTAAPEAAAAKRQSPTAQNIGKE